MNRKGIRPGFKFGLDLPGGSHDYRRVLPFRRSWIAIGVLAIFDAVFLIPLIMTFRQASSGGSSFDSLFDLVMTVFLSAWMLGWSIAPILMTTILLLMLFGREVIRARPGLVELMIGIPGIGFSAQYDATKMRNLRLEQPQVKSGSSWRGEHLVFDYGANAISFGSAIDTATQTDICFGLESASGTIIGKGTGRPEDLQSPWEESEQEAIPVTLAQTVIESEPVTWSSPSALALIIANLVPIAGAIFLDWSLSDVMVLYWAESAVVGFFNLLKIVAIGRWAALFYGPFFLGHFGGFMSVHFLFIYILFVEGANNGMESGGDLASILKLFIALWPALAALFISHAYSFFANFIGREEFRGKEVSKQMAEPYSRIIFMHLVLIFGGGLSLFLPDPAPVLFIIIVAKIIVDLKAHIRERHNKSSPDGKK